MAADEAAADEPAVAEGAAADREFDGAVAVATDAQLQDATQKNQPNEQKVSVAAKNTCSQFEENMEQEASTSTLWLQLKGRVFPIARCVEMVWIMSRSQTHLSLDKKNTDLCSKRRK